MYKVKLRVSGEQFHILMSFRRCSVIFYNNGYAFNDTSFVIMRYNLESNTALGGAKIVNGAIEKVSDFLVVSDQVFIIRALDDQNKLVVLGLSGVR